MDLTLLFGIAPGIVETLMLDDIASTWLETKATLDGDAGANRQRGLYMVTHGDAKGRQIS